MLLSSYSYADSNTKTYCVPTDLTKYNPSPTNVVKSNLSELTDTVEKSIIIGNSANTETQELNDSPIDIYTLTNETLLTYLEQQMRDTHNASLMDTNSVIGASLTAQKVIHDRTDIIRTILKNMLGTGIHSSMSADGTLLFPGTQTASMIHSTAINNSNQSQNSTYAKVGELSYNDIYEDFLCGVSPATAPYSSSKRHQRHSH